ncbi:MAG: hypothetical protein ABSB97_07215 [Thermoplasmata archaeon]|jgi:hypothetical protein
MNRSIILLGVVVILAGFALVASPIAITGAEQFDLAQEAGIFLAPVGLLVVMIGAVQANPELTTVGGTFGNPDLAPRRPSGERPTEPTRPALGFNPKTPVDCHYCRTVIPYDLAICPRCARPRECRGCGWPLGVAEDRTDCPGCHRIEAFCNCPHRSRAPGTSSVSARGSRRV